MIGARRPRWRRRLLLAFEATTVAVAVGLAALWASLPTAWALATRNPGTTAFIELRRHQAAAEHRPLTIQWQWRRLDQISAYLRSAVVYAEDGKFYEHDGVDWDAIEQAAEKNVQRGALSVGGSTITQQLAKNLFLSPSRSLLRKLREILIAGRIEDALSKERILELYLNVVEWGDGIFGAEAAARHWFGRSARQLSAAQAARLAVALPNPFTRSPKTHSALLQRKVARILWQLRKHGLLNREQFAAAAVEAGLPPPPSQDVGKLDPAPESPSDPAALPGPSGDQPGTITPANDRDAGTAAPPSTTAPESSPPTSAPESSAPSALDSVAPSREAAPAPAAQP
jgi:monofunctional glycosyltransferase